MDNVYTTYMYTEEFNLTKYFESEWDHPYDIKFD